MIDPLVIDEIIAFAGPHPEETLVEIGPGLGALTKALHASGKLTLIEVEPRFCEHLAGLYPNVPILCSDVLHVDFSTIGNNLAVFGNLPYSASTDITFHLLEQASVINRAVLMLQKEFVERMTASPGGKEYGALSIGVQIRCEARPGPVIGGAAFHPAPEVDSQIVELLFYKQPKYEIPDLKWFRRVVSAAFSRRRKQLHNSLKSSGMFTPEIVQAALAQANIDSSRRPETLAIEEFVALSNALRG